MTDWRGCGAGWRIWIASGDAASLVGDASPRALAAFAQGNEGERVVGSRSSWVVRMRLGAMDCHVKTYVYPRLRDRVRGWFRNTLLAPSRAEREATAAQWLLAHGFAAARPLLLAEQRGLSGLRVAVLATETVVGERLDHWLPTLDGARQRDVLRALARWLDELHGAGYRDGNLDLRNLLLLAGDPPRFAKVDSPRFVVTGSKGPDALSRADVTRLTASLAAMGFDWPSLTEKAELGM